MPPPLPHAFFGSVEINGQPAPVGAVIEARGANVLANIENNPITVTEAGKYGGPTRGEMKLVVQGRLQDDQPLEFYVNGIKAQCAKPGEPWQDTYPFITGVVTQLNLRVGSAEPSAEPSPTWTPTLGPTVQQPTQQAGQTQPTLTPTAPGAQATQSVRAQGTATAAPAPLATTAVVATVAAPQATSQSPAVVSQPTSGATVQAGSAGPAAGATPEAGLTPAPVATGEQGAAASTALVPTAMPTATAAKIAAAKPNVTAQPILEQAKPPETVKSVSSQTNESGSSRSLVLWGGLGALLIAVALGVLIKMRGLPR
jgi:hypothetical protein